MARYLGASSVSPTSSGFGKFRTSSSYAGSLDRTLLARVTAANCESRAGSVLTHDHPTCRLPEETAPRSTITQIYEGTNQVQRIVMARQLVKGAY
jgi:alkylation response protein AidB-like acyl-CoA dehydrogenase